MLVLDRAHFQKQVTLAAAKVTPQQIPHLRKACAQDLLKQPRIRVIYNSAGDKLIALRPEVKVEDTSALHASSRAFIELHAIPLVRHTINLDYKYWNADEILGCILPEELLKDTPSGFTMVGHIAHMNLRDAYLPYKHIIGQLVLDKNSAARTVVNKLDTIDSQYRNFEMEVLAGDKDLIATQHESGCVFKFDFSKVYWNSRLHTEHARLVDMFKPGEAVCDVMAGVGPFAIPAGKKRVLCYANDLNPASYASLVENIELNKVDDFVVASNMDGRAYVKEASKALAKRHEAGETISMTTKPSRKRVKLTASAEPEALVVPRYFFHFVMNLPATAIEFLDAFRGLYNGHSTDMVLPTIHVHCFTKYEGAEGRADMTKRISDALGQSVSEEVISFHEVRRVAPNKDMYCCSFQLPASVAFSN
ncbi:tRNA methyltransferase Trm5 [Protomyces lactucae-debilis]|uniref:tRNA (guanine(37)-N1)-methyltransferase n=1 Tax=Protomyces lactucae-debilis TaxID=2754530 RepID=A0A1Y2FUI7_PROLT|nr:tRNA methyltransferase Trm5 [Protomyces lactucae-debilis]ORY87662.1 tRNA methyltransferase Trm5 [Protomyces lactucae-debilis]